jgi:hypothetical protein
MTITIKLIEPEDPYDVPEHPIPSLSHLDVISIKEGGGATLDIVIASPLQNDNFSLNRLLDKIDLYLNHVQSEEFKKDAGEPTPDNTRIVVNIHPDSCQEAFQVLEKSQERVAEHRATLEVRILEA